MYTLDIDTLTLGEIAKVEDLSGQAIGTIAQEDAPKGKALAALCFVASRRQGNPLKFDQCLALTVDEANALLGLDEDEDEEGPPPIPAPQDRPADLEGHAFGAGPTGTPADPN